MSHRERLIGWDLARARLSVNPGNPATKTNWS